MSKENFDEKKSLLEYHKMIADMEHDLSQRYHWDENRKHLQFQKWVWVFTVLLGIFAVIYRDL